MGSLTVFAVLELQRLLGREAQPRRRKLDHDVRRQQGLLMGIEGTNMGRLR